MVRNHEVETMSQPRKNKKFFFRARGDLGASNQMSCVDAEVSKEREPQASLLHVCRGRQCEAPRVLGYASYTGSNRLHLATGSRGDRPGQLSHRELELARSEDSSVAVRGGVSRAGLWWGSGPTTGRTPAGGLFNPVVGRRS